MNDFKDRLNTERYELLLKINLLEKFRSTDDLYDLPIIQQDLSRIQLHAMKTYHTILCVRVEALNE